jgi:hypothetical protein
MDTLPRQLTDTELDAGFITPVSVEETALLPGEELAQVVAAIAPGMVGVAARPAHVWRNASGSTEYLLWPAAEAGGYLVLVVDVARCAPRGYCMLDARRAGRPALEPTYGAT